MYVRSTRVCDVYRKVTSVLKKSENSHSFCTDKSQCPLHTNTDSKRFWTGIFSCPLNRWTEMWHSIQVNDNYVNTGMLLRRASPGKINSLQPGAISVTIGRGGGDFFLLLYIAACVPLNSDGTCTGMQHMEKNPKKSHSHLQYHVLAD